MAHWRFVKTEILETARALYTIGAGSMSEGTMSTDVPAFRNHGLGDDATGALSAAYEIACRSLYSKRPAPTVQSVLAKRIVESAQLGERDPDRLAGMALSKLSLFHKDVIDHFGLIPEFFVSAPDAPEILERLWDFAKAAYFSNPMPSVFKERLFVFLSRFCAVRYCIIRHCGFLIGYGHSAGDPSAEPQTIDQVLKLLKVTPPWRRPLEPIFRTLGRATKPMNWPSAGDPVEDAIFALAALVFVEHAEAERAQDALRAALGGRRVEYLLAFLAFIKTAHFWTVMHPGLEIEDDMRELMAQNRELANLLLQEADVGYRLSQN